MKKKFCVFFAILFLVLVMSAIGLLSAEATQEEHVILILEDKEYSIPYNAVEENILDLFGKENVQRKDIHVGEGIFERGLVVFSDSKKELEIRLQSQEEGLSSIKEIVFSTKDSPWRTREGIHKGISLEELVEINGDSFTFLGLGWDYGGLVISWDGGELQGTSYRIRLDISSSSEERSYYIPVSLLGDGLELSSSLPIFSTLPLEIYYLSILIPGI